MQRVRQATELPPAIVGNSTMNCSVLLKNNAALPGRFSGLCDWLITGWLQVFLFDAGFHILNEAIHNGYQQQAYNQ